jgi:citrate synthase
MAPRRNVDPSDWTTALTSVEADRILVRGYPIDELMGRVAFGDAIYLLLTGDLPSPAISRLIGAMLTGFIDQGATPPAVVTRHAARLGTSLPASVAAGMLGFDRPHVGGLVACRELLDRVLDLAGSSMLLATAATELVEELVQSDRIPPPGFGQQTPAADPRVPRLLQMALELEVDALYAQGLRAVAAALSRHPALDNEPLPINVDGAIAAVCGDLGLAPGVAQALLLIAQVPGLVAHALEEQTERDPTRRPAPLHYNGPSERRLRDRR